MNEKVREENRLPCAVCRTINGANWRLNSADGVSLSIARCKSCGHVYQCPRIEKSFADKFYEEAYGEGDHTNTYFDPALKMKHAEEMFQVFRERCPKGRRVLEVGSGTGAFVKVARDAGLDVTGTEMSEMAVRRAKELFGLDLHSGPLETLPATDPFDAAVLWDVIEHCPEPESVLRGVSSRLRPGGTVLLTTGNYECLVRLTQGTNWWCWQGDHYQYFSPDGIRRLGERVSLSGMTVGEVPRLRVPGAETSRKPSRLRFLNPLHVASALRSRVLWLYARRRWPGHWHIGVMLCCLTKGESSTSTFGPQ